MNINIDVKKTFKINGKEYASLDEVPAELREAIKKAMAMAAMENENGKPAGSIVVSRTKVVFNGTEYESPDAMPQDVRNLYESAMSAVKMGMNPDRPQRPPRPDSGLLPSPASESGRPVFLKILIAIVLVGALVLIIKSLF